MLTGTLECVVINTLYSTGINNTSFVDGKEEVVVIHLKSSYLCHFRVFWMFHVHCFTSLFLQTCRIGQYNFLISSAETIFYITTWWQREAAMHISKDQRALQYPKQTNMMWKALPAKFLGQAFGPLKTEGRNYSNDSSLTGASIQREGELICKSNTGWKKTFPALLFLSFLDVPN